LKNDRITIVVLTIISMAVLAYELTQIRIFSFSLHPVIAYSAIALAMLGFGLGATLLALRPSLYQGDVKRRLAYFSLILAVSIVLVNILFAHISFRTIPQGTLDVNPFWMAAVLLPCIIPYMLGGMITAMIFQIGVNNIGRLYFWNLIGSAAGSLTMILLLRSLGAERLLLVTAALAGFSGFLLILDRSLVHKVASLGVTVIILALLPFAQNLFPFQPDVNGFNQLFEAAEQRAGFPSPENEVTEWDPIGRIDIQRHTRPHLFVSEKIGFRVVTIDGGAMTLMLEEPGEPGTWGKELFGESMYAAAYQLRKTPDVLVIGSGGGSDIETALYWKSRSVTGVEISYSTYWAVSNSYRDFVGWPKRKEVSLVHGDGRSFAKSTDKRFDIIQLSGVDTMTMHTAGGAMVAAEDYLYTIDAMDDFMSILKDDGILSVMRFGDQAMNLATIAALTLRERGIADPSKHIIALRQANMSAILVKKKPFVDKEMAAISLFTARQKVNDISIPIYDAANVRLGALIEMLHPAGHHPNPRYAKFFAAVAKGREVEALEDLGNAFVIPTDDRPYYILGTFFEAMQRGEKPHPALGLLLVSTIVIGLASLLLILLPAFSKRMRNVASPGAMLGVIVYFFAIGAGFMLLEVGLIHKATVFVSTPGAAVASVLSAILISSGIGSRCSDLFGWPFRRRILVALGGLMAVSIIYRLAVGPLFDSLYGLPVFVRCVIAALTIAPAGFFMGWFFPTGLRIAGAQSESLVPWGIAVNGFASVIGSLATLFLGIMFGLTGVFLVALGLYLVAIAALLPLARAIDSREG
jgi:spermidine synthase